MAGYKVMNGGNLSETETVLPTYWATKFTKLCLGMKYNGDTNWIPIDHNGTKYTLFSIIITGEQINTNLNVSQWKSLLHNSSLQVSRTSIEQISYAWEYLWYLSFFVAYVFKHCDWMICFFVFTYKHKYSSKDKRCYHGGELRRL
jgi:hypothetical protein